MTEDKRLKRKKKIEKSVVGLFSGTAFPKLKRVFKTYVMQAKANLFFAILFMILFALTEAAAVSVLEPVFNEVFIDKNRAVLSMIGLQILILFIFRGLTHYFQAVFMAKVGVHMVRGMQNDLFAKVVDQDIVFFQKNESGQLLIHFTSDLEAIRDATLNGLTSLIKDSLTVVFMVGLMFWKSFEMALVVGVLFPLAVYPVVYFGRKVRKLFSFQQVYSGSLFSLLSQIFQGIRIVKSYNLEDVEKKSVADNARDIAKTAVKMTKISNIPSPLMEIIGGVAMAATLGYGGMRIMQGQLTTGEFMVFLLAIVAAYKPMKNLANLNARVQRGVAAIDRVFVLMDQTPLIKDKKNATTLEVTKGKVEFKKIDFSYTGEHQTLSGVSITAKPGQKIALVGLAGSGKSTVVNLLQRFYEIHKGDILIDGQNIKDVTMKSLRSQIGYVSQDVVLFDGTIASNIMMGRPSATEEDMITAAKRAGAHEFILRQPEGYETKVGERGGNLSGGQKQMVSIARAMLKDAPILILDEATSALDSKSEQMVQKGLSELSKGRTSFVIAHRLSTIRDADVIYVMEEGHAIEHGTHADLLKKKGRYYQLHTLQYGGK